MSKIKQVVRGMPASDGAGVKLQRVIGQAALKRLDPFLMLDEFGSHEAQDYIAGFPAHPHRGFQTVTYMIKGKMGHKDSVGNEGIIEDGGIQWMNAGKGIIHEEMPKQTEGQMRGFQLWVNLPASLKMSPPAYQDIKAEQIPEQTIGQHSQIRVLVGQIEDLKSPVYTEAIKPQFYDVHSDSADEIDLNTYSTHNGFIYVYEGSVNIGENTLSKGQLGVLELTSKMKVKTDSDTKFIFVSGEPIGEPVAQYGPFVMNTMEEVNQAISDYQANRLTA